MLCSSRCCASLLVPAPCRAMSHCCSRSMSRRWTSERHWRFVRIVFPETHCHHLHRRFRRPQSQVRSSGEYRFVRAPERSRQFAVVVNSSRLSTQCLAGERSSPQPCSPSLRRSQALFPTTIRLSNHETPLLCHNAIALHALCFFIVFKGCLMLFKGRANLRVSV